MKCREEIRYYRAFLEVTNKHTGRWNNRTIFIQTPNEKNPIDKVLTIIKKIRGAKYRSVTQISREEYLAAVSRSRI